MSRNILIPVLVALAASSCTSRNLKQKDVWVPVYEDASKAKEIESLPPKAVVTAGKIYAYRDFVYQLEENKGIHVYRLEGKQPKPLFFIQVYGAQEMSIREDKLYTNNFQDIVILDIANPQSLREIGRLHKAFDMRINTVPPTNGYFQCVDSTKGVVVGWELQHDIEASCIY